VNDAQGGRNTPPAATREEANGDSPQNPCSHLPTPPATFRPPPPKSPGLSFPPGISPEATMEKKKTPRSGPPWELPRGERREGAGLQRQGRREGE